MYWRELLQKYINNDPQILCALSSIKQEKEQEVWDALG